MTPPQPSLVEEPATSPPGLPTPGRCLVLAVLNVTPDSFSDGGRHAGPNDAIGAGLDLAADGADLIDVGGESTRPGAGRIAAEVEAQRVLPVVKGLVREGIAVSVDTMRASVARAAIDAGAVLINDVSGGQADSEMPSLIAATGVAYVAMHWRGHSATMADRALYGDVVSDVTAELGARLDALLDAGVDPEQVILDPGLGFAKDADHNWALLGNLDRLAALGRPLLIGASRKSFLAPLGGTAATTVPGDRDEATAAVTAVVAAAGVFAVRVHDVRRSLPAVSVGAAIAASRGALAEKVQSEIYRPGNSNC